MKMKATLNPGQLSEVNARHLLLTVMMIFIVSAPLQANPQDNKHYAVKLKTREFVPQEGIKPEFARKIRGEIISGHNPHIMLQFKQIPTLYERSLLVDKGICLLNYIGNRTWYASVSDTSALRFQSAAGVKEHPVLGLIRSVEPIDTRDKISPALAAGKIGDWARAEGGKVNIVIYRFRNTDKKEFNEFLAAAGADIVYEDRVINATFVTVTEATIPFLAAYDPVSWIESVSPVGAPEAYRIRAHLQADQVQAAPYNLTGNGVVVGVFENAHAYVNHPDLINRAFKGDTDPTNYFWHTTNMAGLIAGNGSNTYQNRGMATQAQIYTYDYEPGTGTGTTANNNANYLNDLQTAVGTHNIDIASNSWGVFGCNEAGFGYGDYVGLCPSLDAAVRGDYGKRISMVFSAGNERDGYYDGTGTENTSCITETVAPYANYFSTNNPKPAKNTISVGAIDSYNNMMSQYSSWGPVNDGRLKPEIVASGNHNATQTAGTTNPSNTGQIYLAPYYPTSGTNGAMYGYIYQTSAAGASASGCIALLLEACRNRLATDVDPLPSTLKALIIHSAMDLDDATVWYNPGPDYASGYGLLQIRDAVDLVQSLSFREGKVTTGRSENYTFTVPPGATEVKVTLAWDDYPAVANANPALVNDIDLKVYSPNNTLYYPWTLDPGDPSAPAIQTSPDRLNNVEQVQVSSGITPGTWRVVVEPYSLPEPPQRYSLVSNYQLDGQIDVIQVLDRSGSMGGMVAAGSVDTKIEKLRDASSLFVSIMNPDLNNRLGLVLFNQDVVPFAPVDQAGLSVLDGPRANHLINNTITPSKITSGGTTSIGDGLRQAMNDFLSATPEPEHSRSILLVTDGKENTPEMIATVKPDLIANDITVYVLGLGYGAGVDEARLVDLVEATQGTYRITSDNLIFQKLFIEALAGAVDWSVISDPVGTISRGLVHMIPVVVQPDELGVTFTAYWEGPDNAIDCELVTPSGKTITGDSRYSSVRYGKHESYIYYHVDFPLVGELAGDWDGEWKMKLTGNNTIDRNVPVRYSTSCFAESGPELEVMFDRLKNLTGDYIQLEAKLTRGEAPVTGATIKVSGDIPNVGAGNVLHDGVVNWDMLHQPVVVGGDTLSLIDRKLQLLSNGGKTDVLPRDSATIVLYDDGLHGDRLSGDGIYANKFSDTRIQGSYTFRFVASGIPSGGGKTSTCEWTKSFFNEVKIDPAYSTFKLDKSSVGPSGVTFDVDVTMRDQFGNYMGPGHEVRAKIPSQGPGTGIRLDDLIDGTYSGKVFLSNIEFNAGTPVEITVDGKEFTRLKTMRRWSASLHGGTSVPTGNFANDYKAGMNLILDIDFHFNSYLALIGMFGFNDFKSNSAGISDNYWINLSANLRYYKLFRGSWSVFAGGGPGYYIPESGNSAFGANVGLGLNYEISPQVNLELGTGYHIVFDNDIKFIQNHLGIVLRF
jgi:hypothetical protein